MLFNSGIFLQFFAAFLLLYYFVRNHLPARNWLIVIASYVFYGAWDYRLLPLLIFSSLLDYSVGLLLASQSSPPRRKLLLTLSIVANLGILGFFKYYDFFVESFSALLGKIGLPFQTETLGIILPVGISFYTFQTMSYTIDVYRGVLPPCRSLVNFLAYVSFFPQLVAGPIERAAHLLPQFARTVTISRAMLREGLWLSIWGMFKKIVIADNLAPLVEMTYSHPQPGALLLVLGTFAFALQIYCDFSGYSDIARGVAKILGFDIMINFNVPYLASNIREFWQRWHISLSTWLRDYLYIPLGGNRGTPARTCYNLFLTMVLGGLWHGAKWTFVVWGAWHGLGLIAHRLWTASKPRPEKRRWNFAGWILTFAFVLYGWLLFRADSFAHIVVLTSNLAHFTSPSWLPNFMINLALFTLPLAIMQLCQFKVHNLLAPLSLRDWSLGALEGLLLIGIIIWWEKEKVPFIYFQF